MEFEHFCDGPEGCQMESRANAWFRSSSDEELDIWDLVHIAGEDRQDGRCRFLILALIKGINDDQSLDVDGFEWTNNGFLQLRAKRLPSNIRVCPQHLEQLLAE